MSLWDLLKGNKKDVFQQYADNMQPLQQELPLVQVEGGMKAGNPDNLPTPKKLTLTERLLGVQATPTDNIDPNTMNVTVSENPRRGGLLNDLMNGAKENFDNEFNVNNLIETQTPDGRTKGFAYRLGEGLGTVARGLSGWAGDAWAAGYNGLDAGMNRQAIRTGDRLYRQQLKDNYGFTDEQLDKARGYIDAKTFNNLTKSQNSAMNLALRQQTTESMNRLRELQIEKQRIINSTLPEMQKAKLLQENAKAAHAEEMQLARINYYNNAAANPLGWANYGLKVNQYEDKKAKDAKEAANEQAIVDSLTGGSTPPATPKNDGWAF